MAKRKSTRRSAAPVEDPIANIFAAWRLWLLGALIGALLAWAIYQIAPPGFRARATVVVDNNLEEAWVFFPDRQLFQFLARETERLEQLAWSDEVMQAVADQAQDISVADLRSEILQLGQPSDGGWHFYADHVDVHTAHLLAAAWAHAFVAAAQAAVVASPDLQIARADLSAEVQAETPDEERIRALMAEIDVLAEHSKGISIYTELHVSQGADLPTERSVSQATYMLVGSIVGALAAPLSVQLRPTRKSH
ncbi:MAG: hypothetical protein WEC37_01775 [Anaerolineales bacterium]